MPAPVLPDPGPALQTFLRAAAGVTALVGDRVYPSLSGSSTAIRYSLVSHLILGNGSQSCLYQIECWGPGNGAPDTGVAAQLAAQVIAYAPDFHGAYGPVWIEGTTATTAFDAADPDTHRPRQIVEYAFVARPA